MSAIEHFVRANGLSHHVIEHVGEGVPVVVLHGYLDLARTFTRVLDGLAESGRRVIALDFRGHGLTDRAPEGSYYHFADYVADVIGVLDALGVDRVDLVAHSMGGSVATMIAGAFPQRVRTLTLIEGVGPPAMPAEVAPDRTALWIEGMARVRSRPRKVIATLDEVAARMSWSNQDVAPTTLREMARLSVREVEGGYAFLFDPMHQTTSPGRFDARAFEAYVARIACPVLMVAGRDAAEFSQLTDRALRYPSATWMVLEGAGHMIHWTRPRELAAGILRFVSERTTGRS